MITKTSKEYELKLFLRLKSEHDKLDDWDCKRKERLIKEEDESLAIMEKIEKGRSKKLHNTALKKELQDELLNMKEEKGCPKCGRIDCMYLLTGEEFSKLTPIPS